MGRTLLAALFGPAYVAYAPLLVPLGVAMVLQLCTYLFNVRLRAMGSTRAIFFGDLAATALLLLLLFLIPIDPHGQAIATALACAQGLKLAVLLWFDTRASTNTNP